MDKDQVRQKVTFLARDINSMRRDLAIAVRHEEYKRAALLHDDACRLQQELLQLVNKKPN
jgi:protein-arginine kinase activator protein McsA